MKKGRIKNGQLAAALAKSGMSQYDVAAQAGVHRNTICRLLCQRQAPKPETAQRIATALNTSPENLGWLVKEEAV